VSEESTVGPSDLEVLQVKYGDRVTRKSIVFYEFDKTGQADAEQPMDYSFWVARNHDTVILVDTGYPIGERDWLGEVSRVPTPGGLELLGIKPLDVSLVIATHFHYDHIGYLHLFANAQIVAGRAEYHYWRRKFDENGLDGEFATAADLAAVERADAEGRLRLVDRPTDVFPGIRVYPVGGHCPGQLFVFVQSKTVPLILASDAAHLLAQVEKGWAFVAHTDLGQMRDALSLMSDLSHRTGAAVIPGHDPIVRASYPAIDGPAHDIATILG